jgi:hypothetical protein
LRDFFFACFSHSSDCVSVKINGGTNGCR